MVLKYPKKLWILAIGLMINVTGTSFLWPLTTIYVSGVLNQSITMAGVVLMLQSATGLFGSLLGGYLYDRIGGRKAILFGVLISIIAVVGLAFLRQWGVYVGLMMLLGFSNGMIPPAVYAMAGGVWPEGGRKSFNLLYVSQNIGVAIGTALGGVVAQLSFQMTFLTNAATYILFAALVWFGLNQHIATQPRGTSEAMSTSHKKFHWDRGFISLLFLGFGFAFIWITYVQWQTSISAYMTDLGYPLPMYSLLWTINGAFILLIQPFSSFIIQRWLPNIRSQLLVGGLFFILCFFLTAQIQPLYAGFIIGMIIMTMGEIFIWPAVPNAAAQLAPDGKLGLYQGIVNFFATAGRMVGPLIGGFLFESIHIGAVFYGMLAFIVVAVLCFVTYHTLADPKRKPSLQK